MKRIFTILAIFALQCSNAQNIASWNFFGESSPTTSTADFSDPNLSGVPILVRGAGAASSTASNSFRTVGFQNNGISVANTDYFEFSFTPQTNYRVNFTTINARMSGTTAFSATPGVAQQYAYRINSGSFNLIASPVNQIGNGAMAPVDLSSITALQNVTAGNTITFRFYASGQTTTGGWGYFSASAASNDNGLEIAGLVSLVNTNSNASNIIANPSFVAPTNVNYANFQATDITAANSVEIAQFTIQDGGSTTDADALGTTLTALSASLSNAANIRRIAIYDGNTEIAEVAGAAVVNFATLTGLTAPDGGSKTYSVRVTYNTLVTDNQQYTITHTSATADAAGSSFATSNAGAAASSTAGDDNRIEVTADRIVYGTNTTSPTGTNTAMSPSPTVRATDANTNLDLDFTGTVSITSSGTLATTPIVVTAVGGLATFANITHTTAGTGLVLNATSGAFTAINSNAFDITTASATTDFFRSKQAGNWNAPSTWESSANNIDWNNATLSPNNEANGITILHTVTITAATSAVLLTVENGGTLINALASGAFSVTNGTGTDMTIKNGGVYQVTTTVAYSSHISIGTGATTSIETGGIIRLGNGTNSISGGGSYGSTANTYIWNNGAILDWNSPSQPAGSGVTYFPGVAANVIPIFRFSTTTSGTIGGGSSTIINGLLDVQATTNFAGNSTKTFRNGIIGSANLSVLGQSSPNDRVIINGNTAQLGGTGTISLVATGVLDVGSVAGTTVTMTGSKTIDGGLNFNNTGYMVLDAHTLTINNNVTGGSNSAFVVTNGAGSLKLANIANTTKNFAVGATNTTYTPVTITNAGTVDNFSVRAFNTLAPCLTTNGRDVSSVNAYWDINEDLTGGSNCTITLDYGPNSTGSSYTVGTAKVAHCDGTTVDYTATGGVVGTVATGSSISIFSPFGITSDLSVLPTSIVTQLTATKDVNTTHINWTTINDASVAQYVVERSIGTANTYIPIATITRNNSNQYTYHDATVTNATKVYYRIKLVLVTGNVTYTKIVLISNKSNAFAIEAIYPNPVTNTLGIAISNANNRNVQLAVYNNQGKIVLSKMITNTSAITTTAIDVTQMPSGTYYLRATNNSVHSVSTTFVKQ